MLPRLVGKTAGRSLSLPHLGPGSSQIKETFQQGHYVWLGQTEDTALGPGKQGAIQEGSREEVRIPEPSLALSPSVLHPLPRWVPHQLQPQPDISRDICCKEIES